MFKLIYKDKDICMVLNVCGVLGINGIHVLYERTPKKKNIFEAFYKCICQRTLQGHHLSLSIISQLLQFHSSSGPKLAVLH